MNIALVFPRLHCRSGDPPLGIGYLASNIPPPFRRNLTIIDGTFLKSVDEIYKLILSSRPDIVGIYFDTMSYDRGIKIAHEAKKLNAFVIAGGPHATVRPHTVVDHVDAIAFGEAEITFAEVVQRSSTFDLEGIKGTWYKKGGDVIKNPPRDLMQDLDSLNPPDRRLFEMNKYMAAWHYLDILSTNIKGTNVVASRACPFNCTYCQPTLDRMFGKNLRMRTPGNIVTEIAELKNDYGIRGIFFHDDTLTINKPWLNELCDRLTRDGADVLWACNSRADVKDEEIFRRMYKAGLRYIHIGVESGSQRILDNIYRKRIKLEDIGETIRIARKVGIRAGCFFMLGAPTETREEINRTIRFASSLDIDEATFNITTPFPMTYLYDMVKELNYKFSEDYSDYNYYSRRSFTDPNMSTRTLKYFQQKALFSFYLKPRRWGYLLRHLISANGLRKLLAKIRRFYK